MSHNPSCPNCDFLGNISAAPANAGAGAFMCEECGTRWRELEDTIERSTIVHDQALVGSNSAVSSAKWGIAMLAIFAFVTSLYLSSGLRHKLGDKNVASFEQQGQLSLANISIERFENSGRKILIISGEVRNNSSFKRKVPSVVMYWGRKGSSGYFDRIYHPALQNLAPGASFKFRTAIRKPRGGTGPINLEFGGA